MRPSLLVLLFSLLFTTPSLAQPSSTRRASPSANTDPQRQARSQFDDAARAIAEGRFAEARDLLRSSLALFPRPATAFNLAIALRGTGETRAAVAVFDALLSGEYGRLNAAQQEEARTLREGAAAEIATLVVLAEGRDELELRVDALEPIRLAAGETRELALDAGDHVVLARRADGREAERRIRLERSARVDLALDLESEPDHRPGTLAIEADDPTATVEIVGVGRATHLLERELAPGSYRVRVHSEAGSRESTVVVPPGRAVRLVLESPRGTSLLSSPWFWVAAAGVAVLGTTTIVILASDNAEPVGGDLPAIVTLRRN